MRYQWLPYNYTLAYENATTGAPLARPLNYRGTSPDDRYALIHDEYLWGDEVLVAPVMTPGAKTRKVIFPQGDDWLDWYNPAMKYKGGTTATVKTPIDRLPLFVKAGAFIPQYEQPLENVTQYDPRLLTIKYFPSDKESSYILFDDNRQSPTSLIDGEYRLDTFTGRKVGQETQIRISSKGAYQEMAETRTFTIEIPNTMRMPREVVINYGSDRQKLHSCKNIKEMSTDTWHYDYRSRTLTIRIAYDGKEVEISEL